MTIMEVRAGRNRQGEENLAVEHTMARSSKPSSPEDERNMRRHGASLSISPCRVPPLPPLGIIKGEREREREGSTSTSGGGFLGSAMTTVSHNEHGEIGGSHGA